MEIFSLILPWRALADVLVEEVRHGCRGESGRRREGSSCSSSNRCSGAGFARGSLEAGPRLPSKAGGRFSITSHTALSSHRAIKLPTRRKKLWWTPFLSRFKLFIFFCIRSPTTEVACQGRSGPGFCSHIDFRDETKSKLNTSDYSLSNIIWYLLIYNIHIYKNKNYTGYIYWVLCT